MGEVVPARTSLTLLPHPLALCCHYPVSKCCSASIVVTGTVRVNDTPKGHQLSDKNISFLDSTQTLSDLQSITLRLLSILNLWTISQQITMKDVYQPFQCHILCMCVGVATQLCHFSNKKVPGGMTMWQNKMCGYVYVLALKMAPVILSLKLCRNSLPHLYSAGALYWRHTGNNTLLFKLLTRRSSHTKWTNLISSSTTT